MTSRTWRFCANFHGVGLLAVIVQAPNWQGGVRKAALAIKALPEMKGKRLRAGSFTIQEVDSPEAIVTAAAEQASLPVAHGQVAPAGEPDGTQTEEMPQATDSEPQG